MSSRRLSPLLVVLMIPFGSADIPFMLVNSLLVLAIAVTCGFIMILAAPVLRASYFQGQQNLEERFLLIKLRIVRKYYPQLQELTYTEILEQYDVDALYNDIGKSPYSAME